MTDYQVGDFIRCQNYKEARRVEDTLKQEGYAVIIDYGKHTPKPIVRITGEIKHGN